MNFTPRGQALQDKFVFEVLVKPENLLRGTFIDIGACHPIELSNTYALEQLSPGWRGRLYDIDPNAIALCGKHRKSVAILGDAPKLDWLAELAPWINSGDPVDYLSLDVDWETLATLKALPLDRVRFRVITIENDKYRFGPEPQAAMRAILAAHGYEIVCADVRADTGEIFEDWAVDPKLVPLAQYERFRCEGKKWTEIFP